MTQAMHVTDGGLPAVSPLRLGGRFLAEDGSEHPCFSRAFGPDRAEIEAKALPGVGETLLFYMDGIGGFQAVVTSRASSVMEIRMVGNPVRRGKVSQRVSWLLENDGKTVENRDSRRLVPRNQRTTVAVGEARVEAMVVDVSLSGASLSWDLPLPEVGTPVTVGLRRATVVRHTDGGFAVRFAMQLPANSFDEGILL